MLTSYWFGPWLPLHSWHPLLSLHISCKPADRLCPVLLCHLLQPVKRQDKIRFLEAFWTGMEGLYWSCVWGTAWQLWWPLRPQWWYTPFCLPSFHSAFWLLKLSISLLPLFPCQLSSIPSTHCLFQLLSTPLWNDTLLSCGFSSSSGFIFFFFFFFPDFHFSKRN